MRHLHAGSKVRRRALARRAVLCRHSPSSSRPPTSALRRRRCPLAVRTCANAAEGTARTGRDARYYRSPRKISGAIHCGVPTHVIGAPCAYTCAQRAASAAARARRGAPPAAGGVQHHQRHVYQRRLVVANPTVTGVARALRNRYAADGRAANGPGRYRPVPTGRNRDGPESESRGVHHRRHHSRRWRLRYGSLTLNGEVSWLSVRK